MKYEVIKALPFSGFNLVGQIKESSLSPEVVFTNTEYFKPVIERKYNVGTTLVYKGALVQLDKYTSTLRVEVHYIGHGVPFLVNESELSVPTFFWFINSNGQCTRDFTERKGLNPEGMKWKTLTGNYFKSLEDAHEGKAFAVELFAELLSGLDK